MNLLFPIPSIEGTRWETKINELGTLEEKTKESKVLRMVAVTDIPHELRKRRIGEIVYLAGEVSAIVLREYLNSYDGETPLVRIAETDDRSIFCPVNPNYFQKS